ncbi:hypothetical protein AAGW04_07025 [Pectobacterium aroidearum]|uniref:hypothetical protein n=1 Tax=Pectobacterium aroidearum TaxID=1201031 RepID=UPI00315950E1
MGGKYQCSGLWNGNPFNRIIEAEDKNDCYLHWQFWAMVANAELSNLEVEEIIN